MRDKKIVVIGSGIAGITALIKLRELGYRPILITKGAGASYMFSGSYDIASILESKHLKKINIPIMEQIKLIKARNKNHPYNKINDIKSTLNNSFELINNKLNLKLSNLDLQAPNYLLPTQTGNLKESALIDKSFLGLDINSIMSSGKNYGILNFTLFNNFFHEELLYNLNLISRENKSKSKFFTINFDFLRRSSDVNLKNHDLANIIENSNLYIQLIDKIKEIIKNENISDIISPAVWGINKNEEIIKLLKGNFNLIETISTIPSIQGIRLQKKINKYLKDNNIEVINDKISEYKLERGVISNITTNKGKNINVAGIILATGKYIGGGIITDGGYKESVFDIPLFYNGKPIIQTEIEPMFENDYFKKHKAFSIGVKVNNRFQPLNINNKVIFSNVFIAGNIIADYDYIAREGGMGVAISTAYKAAKSLSQII